MPDYSHYETLTVDVQDQVATVTLNRPERLNAVNPQMHKGLEELFGEIGYDDAINAIVLTGAGRAFCAGGGQTPEG
jgi:enoyl-CoA hydratase/carnithine racemase